MFDGAADAADTATPIRAVAPNTTAATAALNRLVVLDM
jgi:hypothetical protein